MRRQINIWQSIDWWTVLLYLILVLLGWINIYAAVFNEEHQNILDVSQRYGKQLIWIGAALVIGIIIIVIDSEFYSFFAYIIYGIMILLLFAVLVFGREVNGARSWFELAGIRIQPAEFAKFATNLAIAKYLSTFNLKLYRFRTIFIIGAILFLPAFLILLQNDTGSALVYASFIFVLYREGLSFAVLLLGLLFAILFVLALTVSKLSIIIGLIVLAFVIFGIIRHSLKDFSISISIFIGLSGLLWGGSTLFSIDLPMYYILLIAMALSSIFYFVEIYKKKLNYALVIMFLLLGSIAFTYSVDYFYNNILESHQQDRIDDLLGIKSDPLGAGYNVNQSKIAIGSGGFAGKGFLRGTQTKFDFVPEQSTDFIFCTVGEEWGFLGTTLVIILFVIFLIRLIMLAERQRSTFSRVFGYGVVSIFFFHVAVNIGMTIGLAPVIGIPLPFFSYGGSSLWAFTILLFIFLRLDASRLELLR